MPQAPWHLGDAPGVEATLLCGSGRAGVGQNGGPRRSRGAEQLSKAAAELGVGVCGGD
jgi:hypothetical protein